MTVDTTVSSIGVKDYAADSARRGSAETSHSKCTSTSFEKRYHQDERHNENDDVLEVHHFSPETLSGPVTAVHIMMDSPHEGNAKCTLLPDKACDQSTKRQELDKSIVCRDLISRGDIDESTARHLFDLYMQNANISFPIFDLVLDTFDSVRESSPFSFAVILYVAARHEYSDEGNNKILHKLGEEVQSFASRSLFENPASGCLLETTEAMTILATHSDQTSWFALGHAYQMAIDLASEEKLRELSTDHNLVPHAPPRSLKHMRYSSRCVRIYLHIVHYEQALAFGTIREPRSKEITTDAMTSFVRHPSTHPSDINSCAVIELVQYSKHVRLRTENPTQAEFDASVQAIYNRWKACFEEHCVHPESYQRFYLSLRERYARIICRGMVYAYIGDGRAQMYLGVAIFQQDPEQLSHSILQLVLELLSVIAACEPYKRVFSWSPTHEGLLLTFAIILAFQVLAKHPRAGDLQALLVLAEQMAVLLKAHPCLGFYRVVRALIHRSKAPVKVNTEPPAYDAYDAAAAASLNFFDFDSILQAEDWLYDLPSSGYLGFNGG